MTFENLKKFDVASKTCWVDFPEIAFGARIEIAPASEANPLYFNAILRKYGNDRKTKIRQRLPNLADFEAARAEDRDMFGKYVVKSWENMPGAEGPLSGSSIQMPELAKDLCEHLPDWAFDRLRLAAPDPARFLAVDEEPLPDTEELSKNSASGSGSI